MSVSTSLANSNCILEQRSAEGGGGRAVEDDYHVNKHPSFLAPRRWSWHAACVKSAPAGMSMLIFAHTFFEDWPSRIACLSSDILQGPLRTVVPYIQYALWCIISRPTESISFCWDMCSHDWHSVPYSSLLGTVIHRSRAVLSKPLFKFPCSENNFTVGFGSIFSPAICMSQRHRYHVLNIGISTQSLLFSGSVKQSIRQVKDTPQSILV